MNAAFLYSSLLLLLLSGCMRSYDGDQADILTSINIIDRDGFSQTINNVERLSQYQDTDFLKEQPYQKVLRIYGRDEQGDILSYITSYHPNGQPKQYLEVINNRAHGLYKEWYSNGVLKLKTFIVGGTADLNTAAEKSWLFDGCSQVWDEKGNVMAEIAYAKGELQGLSLYYHANGILWKRIPFCKNKIEGTFEVYVEDGTLLQTTEYACGLKNGISMRYWSPKRIASRELYCKDLLTTGCYYAMDGELLTKIEEGSGFRAVFGKESLCEMHEYRFGLPEGVIKTFEKNARLIRLHHIKNEIKHGEEIAYFSGIGCTTTPQKKLSLNWCEGKIQGIVRTWYANGILESQREINNNVKNGLATAWYEDGSLMLIEEYDRDKLCKGEYFKKGEKIPHSQVTAGKGTATLFDAKGNFSRKVLYLQGLPVE